ncbi:hypothetical protein K2X33_03405, partial [bacterium]|nr:hypothetical protein [bacterium]
ETVEVKVFTENNGASSEGFRLPGAHTELTWKADEGAYVGRFAVPEFASSKSIKEDDQRFWIRGPNFYVFAGNGINAKHKFFGVRMQPPKVDDKKPTIQAVQPTAVDATTMLLKFTVEDESGIEEVHTRVETENHPYVGHSFRPESLECKKEATRWTCEALYHFPQALPGKTVATIGASDNSGNGDYVQSKGDIFGFSWPSRAREEADGQFPEIRSIRFVEQKGVKFKLAIEHSASPDFQRIGFMIGEPRGDAYMHFSFQDAKLARTAPDKTEATFSLEHSYVIHDATKIDRLQMQVWGVNGMTTSKDLPVAILKQLDLSPLGQPIVEPEIKEVEFLIHP